MVSFSEKLHKHSSVLSLKLRTTVKTVYSSDHEILSSCCKITRESGRYQMSGIAVVANRHMLMEIIIVMMKYLFIIWYLNVRYKVHRNILHRQIIRYFFTYCTTNCPTSAPPSVWMCST